MGDLSSVPGLGRSPGEGKGYPLQYSDLENVMDCIVRGVTKSRTRLSDFHFAAPPGSIRQCLKQLLVFTPGVLQVSSGERPGTAPTTKNDPQPQMLVVLRSEKPRLGQHH